MAIGLFPYVAFCHIVIKQNATPKLIDIR